MAIVKISIDNVLLEAKLIVPPNAKALVIFSHGSGSGRFSPRNNYVADQLNQKGIGTLLADLLTEAEDLVYLSRFNIRLLAHRLKAIAKWALQNVGEGKLAIGFFGASTGAASALTVAAEMGKVVQAVVSRGGRPDMALCDLCEVTTPTLLIVGGQDTQVIDLNQKAFENLGGAKQLVTIAGATHLFEEPEALERVATLASDWFATYLLPQGREASTKERKGNRTEMVKSKILE